MTAAIYARVSTDRQETDNQLRQMKAFARRQRWKFRLFVDHGESGKSADRPQFKAMFDAAAKGEIDVVVFWSLDRFTREGALGTLQHLNTLSSYGVGFRSLTESYLDSCGLFKEAIIAILAAIARQERVRLSERVRAGLDRARAKGTRSGKPIGRPKGVFDRKRVREMRNGGMSLGSIARDMGLSKAAVYRACR